MELNVSLLLNLENEVAKLPEVGTPILNRARDIQEDAAALVKVYGHLVSNFDDLRSEIIELWSKEERNGTIF